MLAHGQAAVCCVCRVDLEKAIAAHGGAHKVAEKLGWELKYKRRAKGYWDSFLNTKREIEEFIEENDLPPGPPPQPYTLYPNTTRSSPPLHTGAARHPSGLSLNTHFAIEPHGCVPFLSDVRWFDSCRRACAISQAGGGL
jgi:hypothetical protein